MAAINQRIPNFLGGVSQQPDTIKYPGQLRVCDNAVPDVTFGLMKRPPGEFVNALSNANGDGYWYEILRDGDEKFLIQITSHNNWATSTTYAVGDTVHADDGKVYICDQAGASASSGNGPTGTGSNITDNNARWDYDAGLSKWIRIWDLADGTEKTLTNSSGHNILSYLAGATSSYAIQTIQDYTIIANPNKTIDKTAFTGDPLNSGDYAFARLDTIAYNTEYVMYTGTTAPDPNTYWRVTAVSVTKNSGSPSNNTQTDNTWDDSNNDGRYAGLRQFSFTDSDCTDVTGHLTVNASSYVDSNTANYASGGNTAENFLGYTPVYKTRYTAQVTLKDGGLIAASSENAALGKTQTVHVEGVQYTVSVGTVEPVTTYEGVSGIAFYRSPRNPDKGKLSMATILEALFDQINSNLSNVTAELIGSGLYLYGSAAPTVNFLGGAVNEAMNVIGNTAQDVSRLPSQCKHGYVAQISNVDNVDSDNYYVTFIADNGSQGSGKWEETVRPNNFSVPAESSAYARSGTTITITENSHGLVEGDKVYIEFSSPSDRPSNKEYTVNSVQTNSFTVIDDASGTISSNSCTYSTDHVFKGFDPGTMPHALVNNRDGTFTFIKLDETTAISNGNDNYWKYREVGDVITNPFPSFFGQNIQKIFFHRNRLGMIAGEQVVMSRPGDYFNFFVVSAITVSDDNPVDITVSDIKPAFIYHVLPIQKGVMMFSDNGQFLLFTESDIFSSKTARLKKVSSYECDQALQPRDMGTSVMFTSAVSAYTRAYEATILDDDVPPKILEQTRVVPEFLPKTIDVSAGSAAIGIITYGKQDSSEVYHYKYYDSGDRREQSAWYSWTIQGTLEYCFYTGGSFFTITKQDSSFILNKYEYVADATSTRTYVIGGAAADVGSPLKTARWFEACLDNMTIPTAITYTAQGSNVTGPDFTDLTLPYTPGSPTNFYAVALAGTDTAGNNVAGTVINATSVGTNRATFHNVDMTGWTVACGYRYITTVELPNYYVSFEPGQYDIDADLRISRFNFEMGVSGPMEFHLSSTYADMDDYIQYESGMKLDDSDFGKPPATSIKTVKVPIQKKNEKYTLQIQIPDPFSTAIISASWDGIYNPRRHARK